MYRSLSKADAPQSWSLRHPGVSIGTQASTLQLHQGSLRVFSLKFWSSLTSPVLNGSGTIEKDLMTPSCIFHAYETKCHADVTAKFWMELDLLGHSRLTLEKCFPRCLSTWGLPWGVLIRGAFPAMPVQCHSLLFNSRWPHCKFALFFGGPVSQAGGSVFRQAN